MAHLTKFGKFLVVAITLSGIAMVILFMVARSGHQDEAIASSSAPVAPAAPAADAHTDHAHPEPAPLPQETTGPLLKQTAGDIVMGDPNAPVTIIEYASLSCSHCAHFHNEILPELEKRYIKTGKVKFINRPFPLNAPALKGAMLAECAGKDRYYTFLKVMFESQSRWAFTEDFAKELEQIARTGGIAEEKFTRCMQDKKLEDSIIAVRKQGEDKLHVESTPTFFINGKRIAGAASIDAFAEVIDPLLK